MRVSVQGYNLKLRDLHRSTLKLLSHYHRNGIHDIGPDLTMRPICKSFQIQGNAGGSQALIPSGHALVNPVGKPAQQAPAGRAVALAQGQPVSQQAYAQQLVQHAQRHVQATSLQQMHAQAQAHVRGAPQPPRAVFPPPGSVAAAGAQPQVSMANIAAAAASAAASYPGPRAAAAAPHQQHMHAAHARHQAAQHAMFVRALTLPYMLTSNVCALGPRSSRARVY